MVAGVMAMLAPTLGPTVVGFFFFITEHYFSWPGLFPDQRARPGWIVAAAFAFWSVSAEYGRTAPGSISSRGARSWRCGSRRLQIVLSEAPLMSVPTPDLG